MFGEGTVKIVKASSFYILIEVGIFIPVSLKNILSNNYAQQNGKFQKVVN